MARETVCFVPGINFTQRAAQTLKTGTKHNTSYLPSQRDGVKRHQNDPQSRPLGMQKGFNGRAKVAA